MCVVSCRKKNSTGVLTSSQAGSGSKLDQVKTKRNVGKRKKKLLGVAPGPSLPWAVVRRVARPKRAPLCEAGGNSSMLSLVLFAFVSFKRYIYIYIYVCMSAYYKYVQKQV